MWFLRLFNDSLFAACLQPLPLSSPECQLVSKPPTSDLKSLFCKWVTATWCLIWGGWRKLYCYFLAWKEISQSRTINHHLNLRIILSLVDVYQLMFNMLKSVTNILSVQDITLMGRRQVWLAKNPQWLMGLTVNWVFKRSKIDENSKFRWAEQQVSLNGWHGEKRSWPPAKKTKSSHACVEATTRPQPKKILSSFSIHATKQQPVRHLSLTFDEIIAYKSKTAQRQWRNFARKLQITSHKNWELARMWD